jgi:hypothetical protein
MNVSFEITDLSQMDWVISTEPVSSYEIRGFHGGD